MRAVLFFALIASLLADISANAQLLPLPNPATATPGSEFVQRITPLDFTNREQAIFDEVFKGNVPAFLRKFRPVTVTNVAGGKTNLATFFAAPDYLAVGSDEDYFLTPMSPNTAQRIADQFGCVLPTRKMVDAIYFSAEAKLTPATIPPSAAMTTVPIFSRHNEMVRTQRLALVDAHPLGALVAGHQKDVVISARLAGVTNKVAIYGWHQTNGVPIQPLYLGHAATWVDYSQCIRLIKREMIVNGETKTIAEVLADPILCGLISDEGVITNSRYPTHAISLAASVRIDLPWPEKFTTARHFGEMVREISASGPVAQTFLSASSGNFPVASLSMRNAGQESPANPQTGMSALHGYDLPDGVRVLVNAPSRESFVSDKPVLLIFFALPNGNTIEQTIGKTLKPGDDWHFDIQHIGAQTRFLRAELTNRPIVVAYLEAATKSWPAWRKTHPDQSIVRIVEGVRNFCREKS